jgi:hypothetical protein
MVRDLKYKQHFDLCLADLLDREEVVGLSLYINDSKVINLLLIVSNSRKPQTFKRSRGQ